MSEQKVRKTKLAASARKPSKAQGIVTTTIPKAFEVPSGRNSEDAIALAAKAFDEALRHHQKGDYAKAIDGYNRALLIHPRYYDALNNLGVALRAAGQRTAALAAYRRLFALRPPTESTHVNIGNVLRELGKFDEATESFNRALTHNNTSRGGLIGLGLVCRDRNWLQQSLEYFERAIAGNPDDPELNWDRALTLLRMGDYIRGWEAYEWRWKLDRHRPRVFAKPEWEGEDIKGKKVLVYGEQGFGDAIQFLRFIPMLRAQFKCQIILELRPELIPLIEGQFEGVEAILARGADLPDFDVHIPLLSLPRRLAIVISNLPRQPYLKPRKGRIAIPRAEKGGLNIGIAWAGSSTQANDHNRSFTLNAMMPLFENPRFKFWSFQKGRNDKEINDLGIGHAITNLGPILNDFADSAGVVCNLDLMITADTSIAHLVGAMGKPVWIALSVFHDWRYDPMGGIAHWYPSARVFQQQTAGNWDGVFEMMARELNANPALQSG